MDELQGDQNRTSKRNVAYVSKDKYNALVAEIRQWEDDLWHSRQRLHPAQASATDVNEVETSSKRTRVRESLANVTHEHVSSLRKFWEGLMTQDNLNEIPERPPLRPIQVPSVFAENREKSDYLKSQMGKVDKCSASQPTNTDDADLPPPPAAVEHKLTVAIASSPDLSTELPPPPTDDDVEVDVSEVDVHSKSMDFVASPESPNGLYFVPELPSTAQPKTSHSYYKRPRLGASALNTANANTSAPFCRSVLRNWPNSTNLSESPSKFAITTNQSALTLPRQRSVTFEPEPGSAPGDIEYEKTDDIVSPYSSTSSPVNQERGYTDLDGESIGILESAARLANSAERYGRAFRCRSGDSRRSSATMEVDVPCLVDDDSLTEASDGFQYSDNESTDFGDDDDGVESVNSEPAVGSASVSAKASKTSLIASPLKGRKSGDTGSRRVSREVSALLDFDCPPTPIKESRRLSRKNTEITEAKEAASLRRVERIKEISDLLIKKKSLILDLSASLGELQTIVKAASTTHKSSKRHVCSTVDEVRLVDLNLQFLLACQQRQCLLDEMSILQLGSNVLIPPMRGEPLRARFQLTAIRLALRGNDVDAGYAVVGPDAARPQAAEGSRPIKYHLIAVLKCLGEGRMYHTQVVTLMRLADLPVDYARPASYVDLPASIDIVPLRPEFSISIEVYCLQTGSEVIPAGFSTPTSKSSRASSIALSSPITSARKCLGIRSLLSSKSRKHKYRAPQSSTPTDLSAAFTLLSSVKIQHNDDLLYGRYPPTRDIFSNIPKVEVISGVEMPLVLMGLPRSAPLSGRLGMCNVAVRLQSSVLKRGFLTIFDESGGMGVWTRCWCKLTADQLVYWRYPEDEMEPSPAGGRPIGRLDMRCIVAPWAVEAPRKICVRANSIYIRSLINISPSMVPLIKKDNESCSTKSILFHVSSDNRWMEQRHLMCADSQVEMDSWVKEFNRGVQVLQLWMPEHFSRLAHYDATLTCSEPVSSKFATRFKLSPSQ